MYESLLRDFVFIWFKLLFSCVGSFGDGVSLGSSGCPGTQDLKAEQAGLKLTYLPASASASCKC